MPDPKICFLIPSFSFGGAERVVTVLASQLACEGYDISVIKYFTVPDEYPISEKVRVFTVCDGSEQDYLNLPMAEKLRRIRALLKAVRPHYAVPFLPHVAVHTFLAGLGLGFRTVQTVRIAPNIAPASRLLRTLRDILIGTSYMTFVQTESQKAYFPGWMHPRITVLPNPVSQSMLDTEPQYRGSITNIVTMGRLTAQKNFEMLIRSVAELRELRYNIQLDIYGEGELEQSLGELIGSLGCGDTCRLQGRTNDVPAALQKADLFVLASHFEGMPNALMEAMAVGLPCISTDCETGPADLLGEDRGLLIPVNDQKAMVHAIRTFAEDPEAAADMGRRAKTYMGEHYSPAAISRRFIRDVIWKGKHHGDLEKSI